MRDQTSATPAFNRRRLLSNASAGTVAATILAGAGLSATVRSARAATTGDQDIFNFALNFEYLGAELYLHALTGQGLAAADTSGTGTKGTVTAGGPVPFYTPIISAIVNKLATDEVGHVRYIRSQLGAEAIAEPTIDISPTVWTKIAVTAGAIEAGQTFDPFADEISLLYAAYIIEDVCVTALAGAASQLTVPADITSAAGLLGTEAAQASAIRLTLATLKGGTITDKISALRARLSGAADDEGTSVPGDDYNFVSNDSDGLVFPRTPQQVLNIAYSGTPTGGGFFPDRVNGVIREA